MLLLFFFFSSRRRHTRLQGDWSSDVCSSDLQGALERELEQGQGVPLASVQLRAPVPRPGKIVCMGGNFGEFVGRKGTMWGFFKSPEAVLESGGTVVLPPEDANTFHHE